MNKRFLSIGLTALSILSILMLTLSTVQTRGNVSAASPRSQTATLADSQSQNQNNLPFPSWWKGQCDTNNYSMSPSNPKHLPAYTLPKNGANPTNYRGVVACGPRPIWDSGPDVPVQFFKGAWGEYEWECVELSMRYMYLAYGIKPYSANGYDVVSNYQKYNTNRILVPIPNSNPSQYDTVPQPGDILSYHSNHTAVVTAMNVDKSGNGTITVMEQNNSANGLATIKVGSNAGLPPWVLDQKIKNWLRHTLDVSPQVAPSGSSVNMSGRGFGANEQVVMKLGGTQIGTATTDSTGSFSTTVTIPNSLPSKTYTLTATGLSSGFSPRTVFYMKGQGGGGKLDWRYLTGNPVNSSPAVVNGVVYVGSYDDYVYALNASTGALLWRYRTGYSSIPSSPTVVNGVVYVGSDDGYVYALNASNGTLTWRYQTGNEIESSPAVVNGVAYVGSGDDYVYALST